jgi:hypothetical protein
MKRFGAAFIALLLVTVILSPALLTITKQRHTSKELARIFTEELQAAPATSVESIVHKFEGKRLNVLAILRTSQVLSPDKVKQVQDRIKKTLNIDTNLIVRCSLARDISSTGSTSVIASENLDGSFITLKLHPEVETVQMAEQVLREWLSSKGRVLFGEAHFGTPSPQQQKTQHKIETAARNEITRIPGMFPTSIDAVFKDGNWLVRAEVAGQRVLTPAEVNAIEKNISKAVLQEVTLAVWSRAELMVTKEKFSPVDNVR